MEQLLCAKCSVFLCAKMLYKLPFSLLSYKTGRAVHSNTSYQQTEQRSPHIQSGTVAMASGAFPVEKSWHMFHNSASHTDLFLYLMEKVSWEEVTGDVTSFCFSELYP